MLEGRIDPPRPSYHRVSRPDNRASGSLIDSYARQVMERPIAYVAQRPDGSTVGTVAYDIESATRALCHEGADCLTIRTMTYSQLRDQGLTELANQLVEEGQRAYGLARAEAAEHYE